MPDTLPQRIEAAEGADRLLDFDIAREVFGRSIGVAKYTASIDAALTLVPEGCEWSVNWAGNSVADVSWLPDGPSFKGYAATPALALCAAALRAKEISDGSDDLDKLARGLTVEQSVNDIPDAELLGRAVRHCRPTLHEPRWSIVSKRFGLGSTYSAQLCRRFGMDPEERRQPRRRIALKAHIERTTHD